MADRETRRGFFRAVARAAGLLGLGGLVWSAASRSADGGRLPCERCPVLPACSRADSLPARDALRMRPDANAAAPALRDARPLCEGNDASPAAPGQGRD